MVHPIARLWLSGVVVVCGFVACPTVGCSDPLLESTAPDELGHDHGGSSETLQAFGDAEASQATEAGQENDTYARQRKAMVTRQLAARDIRNQRVLSAMQRVPRHKFVPTALMDRAYQDSPLPIGNRQTISQPYIVALMTQLVDPQPTDKALDIGTGSGYQAAVLAETVGRVYTIEIVEPLAAEAKKRLASLGYKNVHTRQGDGYRGWPEEAPFDIIIVAAAPDHVPQPLIDQLAPGGTMVIPVGEMWQSLIRIDKDEKGVVKRSRVASVAFVPMTGEAED